ncbi:MAG TPA: toll/interleukin-1 receptor domain-containing protein [Thermoanaerobaculia bacterium]|nr:toll/interleukin-1 receptor domain-containing protein [Thermoanaerobaculia bacterium]
METTRQNEREVRELRGLVERINRGDCVLVLGPRVAVRPDDPERQPLDNLLARELIESLGVPAAEDKAASANLHRAADLYYRTRQDRVELDVAVQDFYEREASATTDFHRDLAKLPFRLCISASPDSLMLNAFAATEGKAPQKGYYGFRSIDTPRLSRPTAERPIVYHLFGHYEEAKSLVLTEGDLIEFLVAIVRGAPAVPDQVRAMLADPAASFLFIGFGFHNWYLRVLLQVMNVYGHQSKAIAFEDTHFFDHPERQQVVGFFSGDRLIEFRPLHWETFAKQLAEAYETSGRKRALSTPAPEPAPVQYAGKAPLAFISYASENRDRVEALMAKLQARGINVWQDRQNLRAGDDWNQKLIRVIQKMVDYVIVLQTEEMLSRTEGVFHREIREAQVRQWGMAEYEGEKLRFLIPVQCGACGILSELEDRHVIDIDAPGGEDALADSILEDWRRRAALNSRSKAVA